MSYILDALRRAEAERERGSVPGLHSPGLPVGAAAPWPPAPRQAAPTRGWWLAGALLLALLGVALGAWWAGGTAPVEASQAGAPDPMAAAASALSPPSAAALPEAQPSAVATDSTPLRLPTPPLNVAPAVPAANPPTLQVTRSTTDPAPEPVSAPGPSADPGTRPATTAASPRVAPLPAAPPGLPLPPVLPLAALTPQQRAAWPPLAVGGSIYSDNPSSRFIVANGQVVREGDSAAPGVVVERIGRTTVVLQWRSLRVEVPL